jgi:hypothetical protein
LVVRANQIGPLKPAPTGLSVACCAREGSWSRSQTAYTKSGSFGSAVIEFLSLRKFGSVSTRSTIGGSQVSPPVVERL